MDGNPEEIIQSRERVTGQGSLSATGIIPRLGLILRILVHTGNGTRYVSTRKETV